MVVCKDAVCRLNENKTILRFFIKFLFRSVVKIQYGNMKNFLCFIYAHFKEKRVIFQIALGKYRFVRYENVLVRFVRGVPLFNKYSLCYVFGLCGIKGNSP